MGCLGAAGPDPGGKLEPIVAWTFGLQRLDNNMGANPLPALAGFSSLMSPLEPRRAEPVDRRENGERGMSAKLITQCARTFPAGSGPCDWSHRRGSRPAGSFAAALIRVGPAA